MARLACIGECMVELREAADGRFVRGFGGDTLNTAIYLARLGVAVEYATALGDDGWSRDMLDAWAAEGVGTDLIIRCPGAMPGLYVIQTDAQGERRFLYWRDSAAARRLFALPETDHLVGQLKTRDWLYYSGISLSLYGTAGRERLRASLAMARAGGSKIAFDTNFRPRGWPERAQARAAYEVAMREADIIFASAEDLELLYGAGWGDEIAPWLSTGEWVLKQPDLTVDIRLPTGARFTVPTQRIDTVVDTTAAGDSFAAAYLAARINGATPEQAAVEGHRIAGVVVQYPGAIIPRNRMPS